MTNHQLKAHCEDVIANPQEHSEMVLAMAKALLPCLGAEPAGYFTYHEDEDGDPTDFIVEADNFAKNSFKLYRSPPAPELKPIELPNPIQQHETCKYGLEPSDAYGLYWGSKEMLRQCIKAIRDAGYEVLP